MNKTLPTETLLAVAPDEPMPTEPPFVVLPAPVVPNPNRIDDDPLLEFDQFDVATVPDDEVEIRPSVFAHAPAPSPFAVALFVSQ